jgi:hypothetical protein
MTIQEMEKLHADNLLCALKLKEYKLSAYLVWQGTRFVQYFAFLDGKLLFEGKDYRPSPLMEIDSLEAIVTLLSFLTLRPGDTDDEYFSKYNAEQMQWAKSRDCESLSGLVSDFENKDEYQKKAKAYFKKRFSQG